MLGPITHEAAARFGARPAIVGPDGTLTYAELDERADALAAGLHRRGVRDGDVVALVLPSGGDWAVATVALHRLGAAVAPLSTALAAPERAAMVELARPRLVLATPDGVDGLPLRTDVAVVVPGSRGEALAADPDAAPEPPTEDDERAAFVCFTSGTTGRPKGALFRVRHLRAIQAIDLGPGAEGIWGGGSPMLASTHFAHVGMSLKLPWYLRLGSTLHVLPRWRADDVLRLVAELRMPTVGVVAPQLALMLRSPLMDELDLSCVQHIVAGGAASPPALVQEARERFGADYSIRYSSTESGGVGLGTAFDAPDSEALHTVGRPRPGVEVRIVEDELQLRSPAVMDGYVGDPEATAATLVDGGWLRTGDLARIDDAGCVVLAGRRTEMFIRGGYNVFPLEVEAVLGQDPRVSDVAVAPRPDDVMGEVGVAVVVPADPARPPTLAQLREAAADALARHKLPEALLLVERIPLTAAQKIDRRALAELVRDAPAAASTHGRGAGGGR